MVEHSKSKSSQPRSARRCPTLYIPGHIGGAVEKVPLGALAVEADGEKVTLELLHHRLEVVVAERLLVVEAGTPEVQISFKDQLSDQDQVQLKGLDIFRSKIINFIQP